MISFLNSSNIFYFFNLELHFKKQCLWKSWYVPIRNTGSMSMYTHGYIL